LPQKKIISTASLPQNQTSRSEAVYFSFHLHSGSFSQAFGKPMVRGATTRLFASCMAYTNGKFHEKKRKSLAISKKTDKFASVFINK